METMIKNGIIMTMNSRMDMYPDEYLIVEDDRISEMSPMTGYDAYRDRQGTMVIDAGHAIIMPGMVNTHCHMRMIPFRGLGDDCRDRLRVFLLPIEFKAMDKELVQFSNRFTACELLLNDVITIMGVYYFEDTMADAMDKMDTRGIAGGTVMENATCDAGTPRESTARGEEPIRGCRNHSRVMGCISSHGTTTCNSSTFQEIHELDQGYGIPLTLHVAEMDYKMSYLREQLGCTPVEYLGRLGVLDPLTAYAHSIRVPQQDTSLMGSAGSDATHYIDSNTKMTKGVVPVSSMLDQRIAIGLGASGPVSGNTLGLFTQTRFYANFHKDELKDRSAFPAKDIVPMAIIWRANALGLGEVTESLELGKTTDITVVEMDSPNMFPIYDPYAALVHSARADNVKDVYVAGSCLVGDKRPVLCNMGEIRGGLRQKVNRTPFGEIIHHRKQAPHPQY